MSKQANSPKQKANRFHMKRTTAQELESAPRAGLKTLTPGAESQLFDEACRVIARIKGAVANLSVAADVAEILAHEVRRLAASHQELTADSEHLVGSLVKAGVCPDCGAEYFYHLDARVVQCDCGRFEWNGKSPLTCKLRC